MASSPDNLSMALFCDFENVALGVRDAQYDKFDIKPVLERLLLKGSIVVKKAYCDWDRYKGFKSTMHEANFELIEIPHVRQSGKNSADIRLVVDALDLCYTKAHVNTFVIISGDSDFSPLVSKLRENAKTVIGVGVKQSTSDLLIANCDEFIFYDDLVRESQRAADQRAASTAARRKPGDDKRRNKDDLEARRTQAVELATETFDALVAERGDSGKIWASVLKEAIKRRRPDFSESYFGFRAFGNLLEEAQSRGLLSFGRDEKSGAYVYRNSSTVPAEADHLADAADTLTFDPSTVQTPPDADDRERSQPREASESRRRGRGSRGASRRRESDAPREEGSRDEAHDTAPTAPFVIPDHAQSSASPADVTLPPQLADHAEPLSETREAPPAARTAFDPHAPENTTPASSEPDDDAAAPRAKRAARAGRTTRKPRATPAQDTAEAAEAGTADAPASTSSQTVPAQRAGTPSASSDADAPANPSSTESADADSPRTPARKTPSRARRPRKTPAAPDTE